MKKAMIILFSGSLMFSSFVNAQDNNSFAVNVNPPALTFTESKATGTELTASEVNTNALTDFSKKHKDASEVMWTSNGPLFSVYFTKNDTKMRSTYNEKGKWEYTLHYFNTEQAPKNIVRIVKNNYSMNIVQVTEIQCRNNTAYLVKMEDEKSFLTVRVIDGEVEFFEQIVK